MIDEGVDRRCWLCKRHRTTGFVLVQVLPCCQLEIAICAERCRDMIPRASGMTVEAYVAKFVRVHNCPESRKATP